MAIPAAVEVAQRKKGVTRGLFEWLVQAPWKEPGFSALIFSLLMFGFLGGITGVVIGTEQLSISSHNTWMITGHFHGTVVGGTTLAFMGGAYYLIPLITRKQLVGKSLASIQPFVFGIGLTLLSIGMMTSGTLGVPRRAWDITFADSLFPFSFDPSVLMFVSLAAVGGILAVAGGGIF